MKNKAIKLLYKKEMLDVLRDKKTVLMMLVVPLILYPLIFILGLQLMTSITKSITTHTYRISVCDTADERMVKLFEHRENKDYSFILLPEENPEEALKTEQIDAYITEENGTYVIRYISSINNSSYAASYAEEVLAEYSRLLTEDILKQAGLNAKETLEPIRVSYQDLASGEESAGNILGMILPFMLIVSLLMGTMYPSIDVTAGERERGTLETLLTLPISNRELIVSKFLTVATIGVASAVLNLISMGFVGVYTYKMTMRFTAKTAGIDFSRFLPALFIGVLCVLAFAVFISAVTMCVTAFAKSYKEANNYITPLMLVVMFVSFIGLIPNVVLTKNLALMPVANISLLIRDLLAFKYSPGLIMIVLVSNVAYGIFAVLFLSKVYNSESILFGDTGTGVQIFEKRSNMRAGGVPTTGDAWLVVAVAAVLMIYVGGSLELNYGFLGIFGTQMVVLLVPVLYAWYTKKDFIKTFRLRKPEARMWPAAIFMGAGAVLVGVVVNQFFSMLFPQDAASAAQSMELLLGHSLPLTLFIVALLPALCEEALFRGYIFSAMEARYTPLVGILISSALFGLFHLSIVRFFGTAFLGACNCYMAHRSKSLFPGSLMHFLNNALAVLIMLYPEQAIKLVPFLAKERVDAPTALILLVVGAAFMFVSFLLIKEKKENEV